MPFVGQLNGEVVFPGWVSDSADVLCPDCGEEMYVRGGPNTDRLQHFVHYANDRKCRGESEEHLKWKQQVFRAFSKLDLSHQQSLFFCLEGEVDVSNTPSERDIRRADVLIRLGDDHDQFGRGIVIEIQHRNTQKDFHTVTYDYLANGYSVRWASRHDFSTSEFDAAEIIADSDSDQMFFREKAVSLPEFEAFRQWDFDQLADLLDGTQHRLSWYLE
ncbi:competence protein CoiA family protein [Halorhabdus rudnickae]|uniref:competence protein CoiA family protein n=1 Tax=Halorhabdus rudnickae TaxID=1775544 RepID=UPI0010828957|nr:competence protein CoiA family protein [Halorhabdus rudnickae]